MQLLTKEQIFKSNDLKSEVVNILEWGGSVKVIELMSVDKDSYEQSTYGNSNSSKSNMNNFRAGLVSLAVVDEENNRLFSDTDARELGRKSASALSKLFDVAFRLSGWTKAEVEELAKKPDGQNEHSNSG